MNVRPLIFADDADRKPRLFACGECGIVVSPKHVGGPEEAERRAAACCVPAPPPPEVLCGCGVVLPNANWKRCSGCDDAATIAAASITEETPDYLCIVGSDNFFSDVDSAAEEHPGAWAHPCDATPLSVKAKHEAERIVESIVDSMCEEAFEDAADHVNGQAELQTAIEAALVIFNAAQTASTWNPILDQIYRLPGEPTPAGDDQ